MKSFKYNVWDELSFSLQNKILNNYLFEDIFNLFWIELERKGINNSNIILYQLKFRIEGGVYRSISYVQAITIKDKEELLEIFKIFLEIKSDEYNVLPIEEVIFIYKITNNQNITPKMSGEISNSDKSKNLYHISGYKLPNSMDLTRWGKCNWIDKDSRVIIYKEDSNIIYEILITTQYNEINLKYKDRILLTFKDVRLSENDLTTFVRIIDKKHEYYFKNGEIELKKIKRKSKYLNTIYKSTYISDKIMTMDLKTKLIKNTSNY